MFNSFFIQGIGEYVNPYNANIHACYIWYNNMFKFINVLIGQVELYYLLL
jgi:hypothetical protein